MAVREVGFCAYTREGYYCDIREASCIGVGVYIYICLTYLTRIYEDKLKVLRAL